VVGLALLAGALYQCLGHVRDDWLYPPPGLRFSLAFGAFVLDRRLTRSVCRVVCRVVRRVPCVVSE
jgi:hypothetical protein